MVVKDSEWCPQHGYPLPCDKCGLGQYELGKQAGIKEVVEWGLETCPHDLFGEGTHHFKRVCDLCWQEKYGVKDGYNGT